MMGINVVQDAANVIFKNIVFTPSLTNSFDDDIFIVNEATSNTDMNWVELYGCIITDVTAGGDPMISSPAEALTTAPDASAVGFGLG